MTEPGLHIVTTETIDDRLRAVLEEHAQPDPSLLSKLPKPTRRDNEKGKCKECGGWHGLPAIHLDYLGHADATEILIKVDPLWNWRPAAVDPASGGPMIAVKGGIAVMWGYLTLLGVERMCVGTAESKKPELEKELIGDLIRNGSMRFGIGVRLWSKADHLEVADSDTPLERASGGHLVGIERTARADRAQAQVDEAIATTPHDGIDRGTYLATIASTHPLHNRAVKEAQHVAKRLGIEGPVDWEALLLAPEELIDGVIDVVTDHLTEKAAAE